MVMIFLKDAWLKSPRATSDARGCLFSASLMALCNSAELCPLLVQAVNTGESACIDGVMLFYRFLSGARSAPRLDFVASGLVMV